MNARQIARYLGAAALTVAAVLSAPVPSAAAQPCPDIEVVFARGTGEPPGVGEVGQAFIDSLRSQVGGRSVGVYAVNYPATLNVLHAADGAEDTTARVQSMARACPNTRMILGGFSQGAYVIDLATGAPMPSLGFDDEAPSFVGSRAAAVAVFGNPSYRLLGGPLSSLSPYVGGKSIDLCNGNDPVCSDGRDRSAHSLYVQSGMTDQAASFAAALV